MQPGKLDQSPAYVHRETLADFHTPLSAYTTLADGPDTYLLESVQGGEQWGRYSIIGLAAHVRIEVWGQTIRIFEHNALTETIECEDPLTWLDEHINFETRRRDTERPCMLGGWAGYFGYACVGYIERRLADDPRPSAVDAPDILLLRADELVVFDNLNGSIAIVIHHAEDDQGRAEARAEALIATLDAPHAARPRPPVQTETPRLEHAMSQQAFEAAVERTRAYIRDGDAMQVVLAQRMTRSFSGDPVDLYRATRYLNPSPYMFLFKFAGFALVGASPEILVRRAGGHVVVRPIAGTRPRGATPETDAALAAELLADPKERAEHLMLIDLGRNDVGRIARVGTVDVTEQMVIERYSHVMHIVSHVDAELAPGHATLDLLRATFPAGTLSGAPKIRALEIIRELEPERRGIYGGAVGYLGDDGNVDLAITIRSAVCTSGEVHVTAGAGVVFDSDPTREWEETLNKSRSMLRACELVESGFALK